MSRLSMGNLMRASQSPWTNRQQVWDMYSADCTTIKGRAPLPALQPAEYMSHTCCLYVQGLCEARNGLSVAMIPRRLFHFIFILLHLFPCSGFKECIIIHSMFETKLFHFQYYEPFSFSTIHFVGIMFAIKNIWIYLKVIVQSLSLIDRFLYELHFTTTIQ